LETAMFKLLALLVVAVVAGVLLFAASRPDTFEVTRSLSMKAPPEKIFALVNDFSKWQSWSPYEVKDPSMKRTLGAITVGQGATYAWEGNKEVGQGEMQISESTAPTRVSMQLHFIKPFEGRNQADYTLKADGNSTLVTWHFHGPAPFMNKLAGLFMNLDKMIGKDFEIGLANMKAIVER
jgi:hypothetical protein